MKLIRSSLTAAPAPEVAVEDANSGVVDTATNPVNTAIGTNPGGSFLAGTVNVAAVQGVAPSPGSA